MQKKQACCAGPTSRVESVLTIDERGQMVLPKDLRGRAGIKPGDKLAVGTGTCAASPSSRPTL
jgi:AbrB family looped-hinge helix DNA binding protein